MNGLTGIGLFRKLELPYEWSPLIRSRADEDRDFRVAMTALVAGGIVNLTSICAFVYLVFHDHTKFADCVMGFILLQAIASFFVRPDRSKK